MVPGIYTAASGMLAQMDKQDVVSNNLANANTAGYKRDVAVFEAFPSYLWGHLNWMGNVLAPLDLTKIAIGIKGQGVQLQSTHTDHSPAPFRKTDNAFDLAIRGPAFFAVQAKAGERYTRDGAFTLDADRMLVNVQGQLVLGEQGPIHVSGTQFRVDDQGEVFVDNARMDRLKLVTFAQPGEFRKVGGNLYEALRPPVPAAERTSVLQGYVETSNVNVVKEMVDLITVMRTYEANQRMVISQDAMLQKAVVEVPRMA